MICGGDLVRHNSGLEFAFQGEVALAAQRSGITRARANDIALKLHDKYKHTFDNPDRGKLFHEVYDVMSVTPTQEWRDRYRRVKGELSKLGLNFTAGAWD